MDGVGTGGSLEAATAYRVRFVDHETAAPWANWGLVAALLLCVVFWFVMAVLVVWLAG